VAETAKYIDLKRNGLLMCLVKFLGITLETVLTYHDDDDDMRNVFVKNSTSQRTAYNNVQILIL
jgi:hypothetical protein